MRPSSSYRWLYPSCQYELQAGGRGRGDESFRRISVSLLPWRIPTVWEIQFNFICCNGSFVGAFMCNEKNVVRYWKSCSICAQTSPKNCLTLLCQRSRQQWRVRRGCNDVTGLQVLDHPFDLNYDRDLLSVASAISLGHGREVRLWSVVSIHDFLRQVWIMDFKQPSKFRALGL